MKAIRATVRRTMVGMLLAALAVTPGLFSTAQAAPDVRPPTETSRTAAPALLGAHIINYNSRKCLVARDVNPGTGAVQTPCSSFADQNWVLEADSTGWRIRNTHTNLCLSVPSRDLERQVIDAPCFTAGDLGTRWSINYQGANVTIWNWRAEGCLVVRGDGNEAPVVTTACNPAYIDQLWYLPE